MTSAEMNGKNEEDQKLTQLNAKNATRINCKIYYHQNIRKNYKMLCQQEDIRNRILTMKSNNDNIVITHHR